AIGANSTIFSLVNTILLRQLPAPHPDQLVQLSMVTSSGRTGQLTIPMFREIRGAQKIFSGMFSRWADAVLSFEGDAGLAQASIWAVSGNFYFELGARPFSGRLLTSNDAPLDDVTFTHVAVIGYGFWQRYFGADPAVLGKTLRVEG